MYHQGENANDGNGNPLNIGNTINRETKYATIYLFLAFALNLMVMLLSLLCGIRLEKGVNDQDSTHGFDLDRTRMAQHRLWHMGEDFRSDDQVASHHARWPLCFRR